MSEHFAKPRLDSEQKRRLKTLYQRDNYHGLIAIAANVAWIGAAITSSLFSNYWFYALAVVIIGARQRAIASLLHEAAHGTLSRAGH